MKKLIIFLILVACCAGGMTYYMKKTTKQTAPVAQATPVATLIATEREIYPETSFVAKIESKDKVALRARVQGFLQDRLFDEGDMVKQDQLLFTIEKANFEASVREAEANLGKAEANMKNTQAQYNRSLKLFKTKDVSEARLDDALANFEASKAEINQAKARLDLAKKDLEYTEIRAPMDGKIGEAHYSVGELIGPSSNSLAEIVRINPIEAVFSVSENQLLLLQQQFTNNGGMEVTFTLADGRQYPEPGKINFVDNALDEAMNTLKLKAQFQNTEGSLISGQYGRINLKSNTARKNLIVPQKTVLRDMLGSFVYVVKPDNTIEKRTVRTGLELPNYEIVIADGLTAGEQIVVEGFQKIRPGSTVTPQITTQTAAQ